MAEIFEVSPNYFLEEKNEMTRTNANNSSSITEKAVEELKVQLDFLRRTLERMSEENSNLVKIISSNFQEANGEHECVIIPLINNWQSVA
jgi:hypothetical protein